MPYTMNGAPRPKCSAANPPTTGPIMVPIRNMLMYRLRLMPRVSRGDKRVTAVSAVVVYTAEPAPSRTRAASSTA